MSKILPEDAAVRKQIPIYSGFIKYFPRTIAAVAKVSFDGNQQHHPDLPLHWDRNKSKDHLDALSRHMLDEEWVQVVWRAAAHCEIYLEKLAEEEEKENEHIITD